MARRQTVHMPHVRTGDPDFGPSPTDDNWGLMQNIFRMWRDFPDLRLGQFLSNAWSFWASSVVYHARDAQLEAACYDYWLKRSGRRLPFAARRWIAERAKFRERMP